MKFRFKLVIILFMILPVFIYCKRDHYKVNTSTVLLDIEIKRLEYDLFTLNPDIIAAQLPSIKEKYKGFLELFGLVINAGNSEDPSFVDFLIRFCTDKQNNEIFSLTRKLYPEIKGIEDEIEEAFRHYLYYFPDKKAPSVFTCITGFNNSIITGDSVLGIGLDRYLGADCDFYPRLGIYKYISARMTPENIVPDCIYGWGASEWIFDTVNYSSDILLSEMIHEGKLKYFEKCILPSTRDELIFGFTSDQVKFCRNNESQMWTYLVEHDLLFTSDQFTIRKFTGEAPFTSYYTNESPGRAAVWLGFRIVESYMMKNPAVKLSELMNDADFQGILEKAKYSPH
jgi:hypothetical protein